MCTFKFGALTTATIPEVELSSYRFGGRKSLCVVPVRVLPYTLAYTCMYTHTYTIHEHLFTIFVTVCDAEHNKHV